VDKIKGIFFDAPTFTVIALLLLVLVVVLALLLTIFPGFAALVSDNEVVLVVTMLLVFVVAPILSVAMVIEEVVNSRKKCRSGRELENDSKPDH